MNDIYVLALFGGGLDKEAIVTAFEGSEAAYNAVHELFPDVILREGSYSRSMFRVAAWPENPTPEQQVLLDWCWGFDQPVKSFGIFRLHVNSGHEYFVERVKNTANPPPEEAYVPWSTCDCSDCCDYLDDEVEEE